MASTNITNKELTTIARAEFKTCKQLLHPNVARYYSLIIESGLVATVLELMTEGDLHSRIVAGIGMPSVDESGAVLAGVCSGLSYLHTEQKVVHLDIKPENIFLAPGYVCFLKVLRSTNFAGLSCL